MPTKTKKQQQKSPDDAITVIDEELKRHLKKEVLVEFVRAQKRLKQIGRLKSVEKAGIMLKDREENIWINFNARSEIIRQITLTESGKVVYQKSVIVALRR